jgi:hypothetical protein
MKTLNQRTEDMILAATLAGFWSGILMDKLETFTAKLNLPMVHAVAAWWPLLLIISGVALLVQHRWSARRVAVPARVLAMPVRDKEQAHAG